MLIFIMSEVMFFVAFFWAFFHASLVPTVELAGVWPPPGIEVLNPWEVPLLNTMVLLLSGASCT
jgi:heme/copper-type cytochrome/quinol oxidase subunit 3